MSLTLIKKYFTPNFILDIGSNTGQFYHEINKIFPDATYTLVEGNEHCEIALKSLGIEYHICLLSDSVKLVDFYLRKNELNCTGNSIYREKTSYYSDEEIVIAQKETNTLDTLFPDRSFNLIKIDCQGSEVDIIKGGINLVKKAAGVLLEVSLIEFNRGSPTKNFVYDFMDDLGFTPAEIIDDINHPTDHYLIQQNVLFIKKQ